MRAFHQPSHTTAFVSPKLRSVWVIYTSETSVGHKRTDLTDSTGGILFFAITEKMTSAFTFDTKTQG